MADSKGIEEVVVSEEIFRQAMFDPGRFVKREKVPGELEHEKNSFESLIDWQWRALRAALATQQTPSVSLEEPVDIVGEGCPSCESPKPQLHPAVQQGGEVQPCRDPWHRSTRLGREAWEKLPASLTEPPLEGEQRCGGSGKGEFTCTGSEEAWVSEERLSLEEERARITRNNPLLPHGGRDRRRVEEITETLARLDEPRCRECSAPEGAHHDPDCVTGNSRKTRDRVFTRPVTAADCKPPSEGEEGEEVKLNSRLERMIEEGSLTEEEAKIAALQAEVLMLRDALGDGKERLEKRLELAVANRERAEHERDSRLTKEAVAEWLRSKEPEKAVLAAGLVLPKHWRALLDALADRLPAAFGEEGR